MFDAFETLSTCRQIGMSGVGPIPWSSIDQFARQQGFADDEIAYNDFLYIMQSLDELFLKRKSAEIERERKKASGKAQGVRSQPIQARRRR